MKPQPDVSQKRQGLIFLSLMVLTLISLPLVINEPNFAQEPRKAQDLGEPQIVVKNEVDAPILLSIPSAGSRALDGSKYQVMLTNISKKSVYAYSLRFPAGSEISRAGSLRTSINGSLGPILKPGQRTLEEVDEQEIQSRTGATITVLLDLVMFTDGTTWGPDTNKIAERLSGQRAGFIAAARQLQKLFKARGYAAVQATSEADISYFSPPSDRTPEWLDGFKSGVRFVHQAISRAYERGGEAEVEVELQSRIKGERR